jgi:hypothetical protein
LICLGSGHRLPGTPVNRAFTNICFLPPLVNLFF